MNSGRWQQQLRIETAQSDPPLFRRLPMLRGLGEMTHLLTLRFRRVLKPPFACLSC